MRKHDIIRRMVNKLEYEAQIYDLDLSGLGLEIKGATVVTATPYHIGTRLTGVVLNHTLWDDNVPYNYEEVIKVGVKQLKKAVKMKNGNIIQYPTEEERRLALREV